MFVDRILSVASLAAVVGTCQSSVPQPSNGGPVSPGSHQACRGNALAPQNVPSPGVRSLRLDLDCDGVQDSVALVNRNDGSRELVNVVFGGDVPSSTVTVIEGEGRFRIAGVADFNRDDIQDIVLVETDESITLVPHVLMVGRAGVVEARFDPQLKVASILSEDPTNACTEARAWPRVQVSGSSLELRTRYTASTGPGASRDCGEAQGQRWAYDGTRLKLVP